MNKEPDDSGLDPNQNFDPNDPIQHLPNSVKPPELREPLTRDQIKKRVRTRLGIENDEIDTLYPDNDAGNKDLMVFYNEVVLKAGQFEMTDEEPAKKDKYKLSDAEKTALKDIELEEKRRERSKKEAKKVLKEIKKGAQKILAEPKVKELVEKVEEAKEKEAFEAAGAHLPPEDQVSFEDMRASMKELLARKKAKKK